MIEDRKLKQGFAEFRAQYAGDNQVLSKLAADGQKPNYLVLACSDSRVDPGLLFRLQPGEAFVIRNVANILPPYECDHHHHGTSAALEFGICYLNIPKLIIMGHSLCGGIATYCSEAELPQDDFLSDWLAPLSPLSRSLSPAECEKQSLLLSYQRAMTFPWIASRVTAKLLTIELCYFDLAAGELLAYDFTAHQFLPI